MLAAPRSTAVVVLCALVAFLLAACERADPVAHVRQLHQAGLYGESIEPLRELLETRPDDPEALYLYGVALTATGEPAHALWAFEKAMLDPDWLVPAGLQRASGALVIGSHDSAAVAATRVLEVEPENLRALQLRARARVESRRDYEGGLADAEQVLEQEPDSLEALVSKTAALLALERVEEADEAMGQLEERFREADLGPELTSRYCFARVEFAREREELELAEERLEKCLAELPSAMFGVSEAIAFYDELGRPDRSIAVLRDAVAEAPEAIDYRAGLAQRLYQAGEAEEAEALLREAAEADEPALALLGWVALGEYLMAVERPSEAADAFGKALVIGQDPQLQFHHAEALVAAERYDEARAVAERITVPAYAAMLRGRVLQAEGRPVEALAEFDAGLTLWPNNAVARYYAARAAEEVGDFDRAIEEFRYALRAEPGAADTRWRLAKLLRAQGDLEPAFVAATHAWSRAPGGPELEALAAGIAAEHGGRSGWLKGTLQAKRTPPALQAQIVAAAVEGLGRRRGADGALRLVAEQKLDLGHPVNLPVLAVLVALLIEEERGAEALEGVDVSLAAHPGFAPFHALRGDALLALERVQQARSAYQRARELKAGTAVALAGLGRLALDEGAAEAALTLLREAAAADRGDVGSRVAAAALLVDAGRPEEARELLEQALAVEPYDPAVALPLARIELAADPESVRGVGMARRAARFGGGDDARALLAGVQGEGPRADPASAPGASLQP